MLKRENRISRGFRANGRAAWGWSVLAALVAAIVLVTACGKGPAAPGGPVTLVLGAYTTPREAYAKAVIPAFQKYWKEKTGQDVTFQEAYQGSGAQARAIIGGFEADIAALSLEEDIEKIREAGLITHDWRSKPNGGMVTTSVVVIAVRKGNPLGIHDWADLARPNLNVLTPDPSTSGGAKWNIAAIYGAALRGHAGVEANSPDAAARVLSSVFRNVSIMDKGARESITNYEKGVGDVAITYENEVLVGRQAGQTYEYVIPKSTILIENPVALVDVNVDKHGVRPVAEAFVEFLSGPVAQRAYVTYGLRPLDPTVAGESNTSFPPVTDLWKIDFLGGWPKVSKDIFGPEGVFTKTLASIHAAK